MEDSIFSEQQRSDNLRLIQYKPVTSINDLTCLENQTLYNWWISFKSTKPSRQDFDISEVQSLASNIYLIERISDGNYLYRLCGDTVGELIGNHYRMVEINHESPVYDDRQLAIYLDKISKQNSPSRCQGNLSFVDRGFIDFESLDCPLFDGNGLITHFVGVICERN